MKKHLISSSTTIRPLPWQGCIAAAMTAQLTGGLTPKRVIGAISGANIPTAVRIIGMLVWSRPEGANDYSCLGQPNSQAGKGTGLGLLPERGRKMLDRGIATGRFCTYCRRTGI